MQHPKKCSLLACTMLIILEVALAFDGNAGCSWKADVITTDQMMSSDIAHCMVDTALLTNATEIVQDSDFRNLILPNENTFGMYQYQVRIKVQCEQEGLEHEIEGRSLMMSGSAPRVNVYYKASHQGEHHTGPSFRNMYTAVVDTQGSCEAEQCSPAWYAPLRLDATNSIIHMEMNNPGLSHQLHTHTKFDIHLTGYVNLTCDGYKAKLGSIIRVMLNSSTPVSQLTHIAAFSPTMVLPGLNGLSIIAISSDEFVTSTLLQVNFGSVEASSVCDCDGPTKMLMAASLEDRLLFINEMGVWEVQGDFWRSDQADKAELEAKLVWPHCVRSVTLPPYASPSGIWQAMLTGDCQNHNNIYLASYPHRSGKSIEFESVAFVFNNTRSEDVCSSFSGANECEVLSTAITMSDNLLLLVKLENDTQSGYSLVTLQQECNMVGSDCVLMGKVLTSIPSQATVTDTVFTLVSDSINATGDVNLTLTTLSVPPFASPHLFIYGNTILTSPDGGLSFYKMNDYTAQEEVKLFVTSSRGMFAFMTESQKLWGGVVGSPNVQQIYPSLEWDRMSITHPHCCDTDLADVKIVSMFFTLENQLKLLYVPLDGSNAGVETMSLSVEELLHQIEMSSQWRHLLTQAQSAHTLSDTGQPEEICPFKHAHLQLSPPQVWTKYTRECSISLVPPELSSELALHSDVTLAAYSVLAHSVDREIETQTESFLYHDSFKNIVNQWKTEHLTHEAIHSYLFENDLLGERAYINPNDVHKMHKSGYEAHVDYPKTLYLDYKESVKLQLTVTVRNASSDNDWSSPWLDHLEVSVLISNITLIQVDIKKEILHLSRTVVFKIEIREQGKLAWTHQERPGQNLHPVATHLSLSNAPLICFKQQNTGLFQQGVYDMTVLLGCAPWQRIMFDIEESLRILSDSGIQLHNCTRHNPLIPCFFFLNRFYPAFTLFDEATGTWEKFEGKFTLKLIGGSVSSADDIELFTDENIYHYNNLNQDAKAKIWGPASANWTSEGWPIYQYGDNNGITWLCQSGTPCANILPKFPSSPEYYFLAEFENVACEDTYCNHKFQFVFRLQGLPVDAINTSLVIVFCSLLIQAIIVFLYYICHRHDDELLTEIYIGLQACRERIPVLRKDSNDSDLAKHLAAPKDLDIGEQIQYKHAVDEGDWRTALEIRLRQLHSWSDSEDSYEELGLTKLVSDPSMIFKPDQTNEKDELSAIASGIFKSTSADNVLKSHSQISMRNIRKKGSSIQAKPDTTDDGANASPMGNTLTLPGARQRRGSMMPPKKDPVEFHFKVPGFVKQELPFHRTIHEKARNEKRETTDNRRFALPQQKLSIPENEGKEIKKTHQGRGLSSLQERRSPILDDKEGGPSAAQEKVATTQNNDHNNQSIYINPDLPNPYDKKAQKAPAKTLDVKTTAKSADQRAPAKTPDQKAPAKTLDQKAATKIPDQKAPAKTPDQKAPAKTPDQKAPAKSPDQKAPAKTPDQKAPAKSPDQKAPAKTPDQKAPAKSEDQKAPAKTPD